MASARSLRAVTTAGVSRDARACVTSVMFTEAKPIPAVTANTNGINHITQATAAVIRFLACHCCAAHAGMARATRSDATPTARNSQPAISVDPSDRAYHPFIVMPTIPRATAATFSRIAWFNDFIVVGGGGDSAFAGAGSGLLGGVTGAAAAAFCFLRSRHSRCRCADVLGIFLGG